MSGYQGKANTGSSMLGTISGLALHISSSLIKIC